MSEKKEFLSQRALMIIGIISLAILTIGVILYYNGLNETFYVSSNSVQRVFGAISYLGEPVVFIIIAAILYLAYNKTFAKNLTFSLVYSYFLNGIFKELYQDPRPTTNIDPAQKYGVVEPSYGFPSGHSTNAVSFWGYLGYEFRDEYRYKENQLIPAILSVLIFLIAISRIIIGVHDLQDIIGGLLLGIGFLLLFIYLEPRLSEQFNKLSFSAKIIVTVIISMAMFLIGTFIFPYAGLGEAITPPNPPPYSDAGVFAQLGGVVLGFGVGYLIEQEYVKYDPTHLITKKKIINVALGIGILLIVFVPLEYLLKINSVIYRFFRYALITFIIAYVVPLICTKLDPKI
ncbi:hypothetical protein LCGC14_1419090 [marine sediment metagenome]|uniref:Phosphatidic acid phosphatase type 2/haloperoxidase domain-containing protein n=1 Tax=marine sediment metagenome TaxID=412755 RepID=A0A0F9M7E6_9ZZZZ